MLQTKFIDRALPSQPPMQVPHPNKTTGTVDTIKEKATIVKEKNEGIFPN